MAHRRATYWEQIPADWHGYDVLIAVADCGLLGRDGWMAVDRQLYTVMVVDCAQRQHAPLMIEERLIDANLRERGEGWLILK